MYLTTSTTGLLLGLMSLWSCTAAPAEEIGLALPTTCTKKTACHTYTAYTTPAACPKQSCPNISAQVCPMYISITTSLVPCANACCPTTGTTTVTTPCPKCPTAGCVIPTATVTMTTGCKTTATPIVTGLPGGGGSVTLIPGGGGVVTSTASVTFRPGV